MTGAIKQWLSVVAQVLGLAGVLYEAFWEGGKHPELLKFYGGLLLGGTTASVPWTSLLKGFHVRIEIRDPEQPIPTLTVDLGNLQQQLQETPITPKQLPKSHVESPPQSLSKNDLLQSSEPPLP